MSPPQAYSRTGIKYGCLSGNCENGEGVYLWPSGNRYEGAWKNGKEHGSGVLTLFDGGVFDLEYKNGKMIKMEQR